LLKFVSSELFFVIVLECFLKFYFAVLRELVLSIVLEYFVDILIVFNYFDFDFDFDFLPIFLSNLIFLSEFRGLWIL